MAKKKAKARTIEEDDGDFASSPPAKRKPDKSSTSKKPNKKARMTEDELLEEAIKASLATSGSGSTKDQEDEEFRSPAEQIADMVSPRGRPKRAAAHVKKYVAEDDEEDEEAVADSEGDDEFEVALAESSESEDDDDEDDYAEPVEAKKKQPVKKATKTEPKTTTAPSRARKPLLSSAPPKKPSVLAPRKPVGLTKTSAAIPHEVVRKSIPAMTGGNKPAVSSKVNILTPSTRPYRPGLSRRALSKAPHLHPNAAK